MPATLRNHRQHPALKNKYILRISRQDRQFGFAFKDMYQLIPAAMPLPFTGPVKTTCKNSAVIIFFKPGKGVR